MSTSTVGSWCIFLISFCIYRITTTTATAAIITTTSTIVNTTSSNANITTTTTATTTTTTTTNLLTLTTTTNYSYIVFQIPECKEYYKQTPTMKMLILENIGILAGYGVMVILAIYEDKLSVWTNSS